MGQEIDSYRFDQHDFLNFSERLYQETELLAEMISHGGLSEHEPMVGFELEAWLLDKALNPAPVNAEFLERMGPPLAFPELAQFNIELNNSPKPLQGGVLYDIDNELATNWKQGCQVAESLGAHLLSIGILPTLSEAWLKPAHMSPLKRYRALNEQVLRSRNYRPLKLNIVGRQHLCSEQADRYALTSAYLQRQSSGNPVHDWPI